VPDRVAKLLDELARQRFTPGAIQKDGYLHASCRGVFATALVNTGTGPYATRLVFSKGCATGTFIPQLTGLIAGSGLGFSPKTKATADPKLRHTAAL
jgi:hypothetical protein